MKFLRVLFVVTVCLGVLLAGVAFGGFRLEFRNPTGECLNYNVEWVDAPYWADYIFTPPNIMGGSVPAGGSRVADLNDRGGRFRLTYGGKEYFFKIGDNEINSYIDSKRYFFRVEGVGFIIHPKRMEEVKG